MIQNRYERIQANLVVPVRSIRVVGLSIVKVLGSEGQNGVHEDLASSCTRGNNGLE